MEKIEWGRGVGVGNDRGTLGGEKEAERQRERKESGAMTDRGGQRRGGK